MPGMVPGRSCFFPPTAPRLVPLVGAEGLAPVALRSQFGSWSGERFRSSHTPQREFIGRSVCVGQGGPIQAPTLGRG